MPCQCLKILAIYLTGTIRLYVRHWTSLQLQHLTQDLLDVECLGTKTLVHKSLQERRRKERKWRKSCLEDDRLEFIEANSCVKNNITNAKKDYFDAKLHNANTMNTKEMFEVINQLLNNQPRPFPSHNNPSDLRSKFAEFFDTKIRKICQDLNTDNLSDPSIDNCIWLSQFVKFQWRRWDVLLPNLQIRCAF